jgi:superfamily I DNA and/or RNA helicase
LDRLDAILEPNPELRRFWERLTPGERSDFVDSSQRWLYFFRQLFATAEARPEKPLVEMLRLQHRMHPSIGNLISHAFYEDRLKNGTRDDVTLRPLPKVLHRFERPECIRGKAIVWIDVPTRTPKHGDIEGYLVNQAEVDAVQMVLSGLDIPEGPLESVVVLTPYRRQVTLLRRALNSTPKPRWARAPDGTKRTLADAVPVFTVDSFQGHQASTVIISLVRNNQEKFTEKALGFLRFFQRVNVMMSRAERLLIVVGSWDFLFAHLSQQSDEPDQVYFELRRLIGWLDEAFKTGVAFKGDVAAFSKEMGV